MLVSLIVLSLILAALVTVAVRRPGRQHIDGLRMAWAQARMLLIRMPLALLAAGFLAEIVPEDLVSSGVGGASGLRGILIASVLGAFVPAGPMVLYPVAVAFYQLGAGIPQTIAFVTGWSLFGLHRVVTWELPMLGVKFVIIRLASSAMLPPLAAILAGLIAASVGY